MSKTKNSQIAKRYAKALFEVVPKTSLRTVNEEFEQVLVVLEDPQVKRVFSHPHTAVARKQELIRLMGLSKTLENFLLLVVEKSRAAWLEQIKKEFELLVLSSEQTTIAEVTSAIALSDEVLQELKAKLQQITGKKVLIRTDVNPVIGGGMVINVDGKVIDGSVKNTLQKLQRSLMSSG